MEIALTLSNRRIRQRKARRAGPARRVTGFLVGLVAIGLAVAVGEYFVATPASEASTGAAIPAVFSGEFVDGAPVYRLPSITVVARRAVDASE